MDVSEFVVAALLLELTPGPNMAYLATLSLTRGRVPGLVATIGVAFGLAVHAIFAAYGWLGPRDAETRRVQNPCQKADVPHKSGELLTQEGAQHYIDDLKKQLAERK